MIMKYQYQVASFLCFLTTRNEYYSVDWQESLEIDFNLISPCSL